MKISDWIDTLDPPSLLIYDIRNPPASTTIATRTYSGPSLSVCGNPVLTVNDANGQVI